MWRYAYSHQKQKNLGSPNSDKAPRETFAIFSKDQNKVGTASGTTGRVWVRGASWVPCVGIGHESVCDLPVLCMAGANQRWHQCKLPATLKTAAGRGAHGTAAQAGTSHCKGSLWLRLSMRKGRKGVSLNVCFLLCGFCGLFFSLSISKTVIKTLC